MLNRITKYGTFLSLAAFGMLLLHCAKNTPNLAPGLGDGAPNSASTPPVEEGPTSGFEPKLGDILKNHSPFKPQPNPYPNRDAVDPGTKEVALVATPDIPEANQKDLLLVDEAGEKQVGGSRVQHVLQTLLAPVGNSYRSIPVPNLVDAPNLSNGFHHIATLLPHAFQKLKKDGKLVMPLLDTSSSYWRAQRVCLARKGKSCHRDLTVLDHVLTGSGKAIPFFPVLRWDETQLTLAGDDEVRIYFANIQPNLRVEVGGVSPIQEAVEKSRMAHPGNNPHLNEFLNRAYALYMSRFAAETATPITDFVQRIHLADCKLTAMAEAQFWQSKFPAPGPKNSRYYIASGNMPDSSDKKVLDITTENHVWNFYAHTQGGSILLPQSILWDRTPSDNKVLEFTFSADTMVELGKRLNLQTARKDFELSHAFSATELKAVGAHPNVADLEKAVQDAITPVVAQFLAPGQTTQAVRGGPYTTVELTPHAADKILWIAIEEQTFSLGNRGEVALYGKIPDVSFSALPAAFLDRVAAGFHTLGFKPGPRTKLVAEIYGAQQDVLGAKYPPMEHLDGYTYGKKALDFFASTYPALELSKARERLERHKNDTITNWRPSVSRDGTLRVGNASSHLLPRLTDQEMLRFWKAQGIQGIKTLFQIRLKLLIHPQ